MPETMTQNCDQAILKHGIFKCLVELPLRVRVTLLLKPLPGYWLCGLDERNKRANIKRHATGLRRAVAGIIRLPVASRRRDQEGFNILFKLLLVLSHFPSSPSLV